MNKNKYVCEVFNDSWTIINIFSKEEFINNFGKENLIYYNSLINLQAVHIEYKRINNNLSNYRQIFNFKNGKNDCLIYTIIDYMKLYFIELQN